MALFSIGGNNMWFRTVDSFMERGELSATLRETIAVFEPGVPQTTPEVAAQLDLERRTTYARLERLTERDRIETKKVGSNARVWWLPPATSVTRHSTGGTVANAGADGDAEHRPNLDDAFEGIDTAVYGLNEDWEFTYLNESAEEILQQSAQAVVGETVWEAYPQALDPSHRDKYERAMERQEPVSFEMDSVRTDSRMEVTAFPSESGLSVAVRPITERKRREQELEQSRNQYRALVENFQNGLVALFDENLEYTLAGGTLLEETSLTLEDFEGESVGSSFEDDTTRNQVRRRFQRALDGETERFEVDRGDRTLAMYVAPVIDDDGDVFAGMGMAQDITDQKEQERSLAKAKSQLEIAAEAGSIGTYEWHIPEDRLVTGPAFAKLFGVDPADAREGDSIERFMQSLHDADRERVEREIQETVEACGEFETEYRVAKDDGEYRWVVSRGHVECDDDGNPVTFPGAITDITERKRAQQELQRRRDQLAVLNSLNQVVQDITSAVIEQSTREEIERTVCEQVADSDSYRRACICDLDPGTESLGVRATAPGVDQLATLAADWGLTEACRDTLETVIRTQETAVVNEAFSTRADPGVPAGSFAAIPIVHEGTSYGVLCVSTERDHAFDDQERAVIGQIGEIVGHAIAATERKQALLSDELTELVFEIPDIFQAMGVQNTTSDTISYEHAVRTAEGTFLVYGETTPAGIDVLESMVETLPRWDAVRVRSEGETTSFELRLIDPPLLSAIISLGGGVESAHIEEGDYRMGVHLPTTVDVRHVTEELSAIYPTIEMLSRRQIHRPAGTSVQFQQRLLGRLTDRQRTTLEAAQHAGFFEWPRDVTGDQLADSLGIASSTFHQHLRKAQRKVFERLFAPPPDQQS